MRAAAEFFAEVNVNDTDFRSVFVAEELLDVLVALDFLIGELIRFHREVASDLCVDEVLDLMDFVACHLFVVTEVKAQTGLIHDRASLGDMLSEHLAEGPVQ